MSIERTEFGRRRLFPFAKFSKIFDEQTVFVFPRNPFQIRIRFSALFHLIFEFGVSDWHVQFKLEANFPSALGSSIRNDDSFRDPASNEALHTNVNTSPRQVPSR